MSKRKWVAAKLFAVLGGAGLAIGICVPRASAQPPPFSNNSYANRYICGVQSDDNFFTGTMEIVPNGSGSYVSGTLEAPVSAFTAFNPGLPPVMNFCTYLLDVSGSSYLLSPNGLGTEVLSWSPPSPNTNPGACPTATFIMSNEIVLRAFAATSTERSIVTETTSNNFLGEGLTSTNAGHGTCLK
jgi:hypothetical protein